MRMPQVSERMKEAPAQVLRGVFAGIGQLLLITDKIRNKMPAGQQFPPARAAKPPDVAGDTAGTAASQDDSAARRDKVPTPGQAPQQAPAAQQAQTAPAAQQAQTAPETRQAPAARQAPEHPKTTPTPRTPKTEKAAEIKDFDKTGNVRLLSGAEAKAGAAAKTEGAKAKQGSAAAGRAAAADDTGEAGSAGGGRIAGQAGEAPAPLPNYDDLSVPSLRARLRNLDVTQVRQLVEYEKAHAGRADVLGMFERRIAKLEAGD
jgi:hypothetical protein